MCRKNCKWDVWGGGKASIWGATAPPLSQCNYVPVVVTFLRSLLIAVADINECETPNGVSPCLNNATCVDDLNRFRCICPQFPGGDIFIVGQRCENC